MPRSTTARWRPWLLLLLLLALGLYAARSGVRLPPAWNPWAPLDLAAPPNWLTRFKLAALARDPESCRDLLREAGLQVTPVPDRDTGPGCGFRDAVTVQRLDLAVGEAFTLACPATAALVLWLRHDVVPAAHRHFGSTPMAIEHVGSYACRNVNHRADGRRSEHAMARALDVTGIVLGDGRRVRVLGGWEDPGAPGAFLREIRDGACRWFRGVLGPDYNAAHRDHFHLEFGRWRSCR